MGGWNAVDVEEVGKVVEKACYSEDERCIEIGTMARE